MASLAVLVYAGVSLAFSVPVDDETAAGFAGVEGAPRAGARATVVPVVDAAVVETLARGGDGRALGFAGTLLAYGEPDGSVPATAEDVRIARALAFVTPDANRSDELALENVPLLDENGTLVAANLTLNVTHLAGNATGFLMKVDRSNETFFVAQDRIVGEVARFDAPSKAIALFVAGALGFVAPLVALIATHRASGARGPAEGVCRECRAPMSPGADFCLRCGAYVRPPEEERAHA